MIVCVAVVSAGISGTGRTAGAAERQDSLLVMFWNIENMFDYRDSGTGESDAEFSSFGQRRWTKGRFYTKCNAIAKTILWIADRKGRLPDVVGFAEVENAFVVRSIAGATALRKYGYRTVHFDSPDHRGIDVALIYREEIFEKLSARPCRIYECGPAEEDHAGLSGRDNDVECRGDGKKRLMGTRDILLVSLKHRVSGRTYHFLVNHHPSKYGGAKASEGRRRTTMERLRFLCDSIYAENAVLSQPFLPEDGQHAEADGSGQRLHERERRHGIADIGQCMQAGQRIPDVRIIAMGDFNDIPSGGPFDILCDTVYNPEPGRAETCSRENIGHDSSSRSGRLNGCRMVNLGVPLEAAGEGTIRYGGKWELIDMFVVSAFLAEIRPAARMEVARVPFLMTRDNTHVGEKPFRTYSGPRYIGGVSDHCPIVLSF